MRVQGFYAGCSAVVEVDIVCCRTWILAEIPPQYKAVLRNNEQNRDDARKRLRSQQST